MSGKNEGRDLDLSGVNGDRSSDGGIAHGALLVAFTDAVMGDDASERARQRTAVREAIGDGAFVDACAVICAFNVVDRIADATGLPLDDGLALISRDVREELELDRLDRGAR